MVGKEDRGSPWYRGSTVPSHAWPSQLQQLAFNLKIMDIFKTSKYSPELANDTIILESSTATTDYENAGTEIIQNSVSFWTVLVLILRLASILTCGVAIPASIRYCCRVRNTSASLLIVVFIVEWGENLLVLIFGSDVVKLDPETSYMAVNSTTRFLSHMARWTMALIILDRYLYICKPCLTLKISMKTHTAVALGTVAMLILFLSFSDYYMSEHYNQKLKFAMATLVFVTTFLVWIRVIVVLVSLRCKVPKTVSNGRAKFLSVTFAEGTKVPDDEKSDLNQTTDSILPLTEPKLHSNEKLAIATVEILDTLSKDISIVQTDIPEKCEHSSRTDHEYESSSMHSKEQSNDDPLRHLSKLARGNHDTLMLMILVTLAWVLQIPGVLLYCLLEHISYAPETYKEHIPILETFEQAVTVSMALYLAAKPVICFAASRTFRQACRCCRCCSGPRKGRKRAAQGMGRNNLKRTGDLEVEFDFGGEED